MSQNTVNVRDINPLEHITSDLAKSRMNYESILNGLVAWNTSDNDVVTVRLATDTAPGFVDYTFPTRKSATNTSSLFISYATANNGCFDVDNRVTLPVTPGGTGKYSDEAILRLSVSESTGYRWMLYADIDIHEEDDLTSVSRAYSAGDYASSDGKVYIVTASVPAGGDLTGYVANQVVQWTANVPYPKGTVAYVASQEGIREVYILRGTNGSTKPAGSSEWLSIGTVLNDIPEGSSVEKGRAYVYTDGSGNSSLYIYRGATVAMSDKGPYPSSVSTAAWYGPVALSPVATVTRTTVVRNVPETELAGFIMQCRASGYGNGRVDVVSSVAFRAPPEEPHRGLKVFDTSNFAKWPENSTPVWKDGQVYGYDDDYSAKMVFDYTDANTKTTNIVNYDGPDLDRGLCIYLPTTEVVSGNTEVKPKDGAIIEFMFRIWPRTALNGRESADLVVNKAQIYVFSLPDISDLDTGKVIAKFSMARVTNFYVWAENVAIPNRPVFYKVRFIYSEEHDEWKTYDYYQIPDHVFLAPKGFVDPSLRTYADDGFYPGLETAGFPLMQDPFGGMDLTRIRLNRIEEDEPVVHEEPAEELPGE